MELKLRVPEELGQRAKAAATEAGLSLNAYLTGMLESKLGAANAEPKPKDATDPVLEKLKRHQAEHGEWPSMAEAMELTGLSYMQLYAKYLPYVVTKSKRKELEEEERPWKYNALAEGSDGDTLTDHSADG